jgi:hypothetical protein
MSGAQLPAEYDYDSQLEPSPPKNRNQMHLRILAPPKLPHVARNKIAEYPRSLFLISRSSSLFPLPCFPLHYTGREFGDSQPGWAKIVELFS